MARFTLPRDLYHGKGSLEALKTLVGKKVIKVDKSTSSKNSDTSRPVIFKGIVTHKNANQITITMKNWWHLQTLTILASIILTC